VLEALPDEGADAVVEPEVLPYPVEGEDDAVVAEVLPVAEREDPAVMPEVPADVDAVGPLP